MLLWATVPSASELTLLPGHASHHIDQRIIHLGTVLEKFSFLFGDSRLSGVTSRADGLPGPAIEPSSSTSSKESLYC